MTATQDRQLCKRKSPVHLSDIRPVVVIDTREQTPLPISRLESVRGSLYSGDYSIAGSEGSFAIERKSIPDLVACCVGHNRERFMRELNRLRGYQFARLLVVGTREGIENGEYRSKIAPRAVLSTLAMIEARYIPVVFASDPVEGARRVEKWIWWFARELVRATEQIAFTTQQKGIPK